MFPFLNSTRETQRKIMIVNVFLYNMIKKCLIDFSQFFTALTMLIFLNYHVDEIIK